MVIIEWVLKYRSKFYLEENCINPTTWWSSGLMLPLALAAAVRVPYTTSPCNDLGHVVNLLLDKRLSGC